GHAAEQNHHRVASQLKLVADRIQSRGVSVCTVIRGGLPADSILEFIDGSDCDLVVMGTHGRRGLSHLVKGSVAEAVLRRASCPVLAAKHFTQTRSGRLAAAS
ncbi:MAG: universal stress protein, partial [Nitrospira sp. LK70]|nr:universal stress protein [Nitrospira sp. LK70]